METSIINLKLVESLVQAIAALSPAEQNLVRSRLRSQAGASHPKQSALDILTSSPGQQLFLTPEEVDHAPLTFPDVVIERKPA